MSIGEMKRYLRDYYCGKYHGRSIDEMDQKQIRAIYFTLVERNRQIKSVSVVEKPQSTTIISDDRSLVVDREHDEVFTIDEYESMF